MPTPNTELVNALNRGDVVAFVGAGVSRSYLDPASRREAFGVPAASEIVSLLADLQPDITVGMPFVEACFLYKMRQGRAALENFFVDNLDRPGLQPLPAHLLLSSLPFASYITTNFDRLMETALSESRRRYSPIIEDSDVPRLHAGAAAVIKMHGCISRPKTIVAAADEYIISPSPRPIIDALVRVTLANKTALFVGYGLADYDFQAIQDWLTINLATHRPRGYAIVHTASEFQKEYWSSRGIKIIEDDLTTHLRELVRSTSSSRVVPMHQSEDWISTIFFESLKKIRSLPTETEVIDAFLGHFIHELDSPGYDLDVVLSRAEHAKEIVLRERANYDAMQRVASELIANIRAQCNDKDRAGGMVRDVVEARRAIEGRIGRRAVEVVERNENILLFSQSKRVCQLLRGVPSGVQRTCRIYIAECRPKSPQPFQDAVAFAEALAGTEFEITIVPDVAATNLIVRRQIAKVVFGAHQIFRRDGRYEAFINSCGTTAIVQVAEAEGIPIYIVAEQDKITDLPAGIPIPGISYAEEESIFAQIGPELGQLRANGQRISGVNVGYDLCKLVQSATVITD